MSLKLLLAAALASIALPVAFTACTSTESEADISASLMAHSWKISSATAAPAINKDGRLITNVLDSLQSACDKHTIVSYLSSDSLAVTTDSAGCGMGHGKWTRSGNVVTTIFQKEAGPDTSINTIVSVSTTHLTLTWIAVQSDGPHTVTEVYVAR